MSGYSSTVRPMPEPQLQFLLNIIKPGVGTLLTAFYGPGGSFCPKTFAVALAQALIWDFFFFMIWIPILRELGIFVMWVWAVYHSYLVYKVSREQLAKNGF